VQRPNTTSDEPWPIDQDSHPFDTKAYQPWSTEQAYRHTLVSGDEGRLIIRGGTTYAAASDFDGYAQRIVVDHPLDWFKQQATTPARTLKLAIYAHGGINSEKESIQRIRVLAPYFQANGIYPIFLTWRTGFFETVYDLSKDCAHKIFGEPERFGISPWLQEQMDRKIEEVASLPKVKSIWNKMRQNAESGTSETPQRDHVLDMLARKLVVLKKKAWSGQNAHLELHLVGHSAGSILLGHLLERMLRDDLRSDAPSVATFTLYAAACSTRFAVEKYLPAADARLIDLSRLWLHYLSDEREKDDKVRPGQLRWPEYGNSLLYLVSRALDDRPKMPLLGMERALDPKYAADGDQWAPEEFASLQAWQARWKPNVDSVQLGLAVTDPMVRVTKNNDEGSQMKAAHGSFDNSIDAITTTLERIKGGALIGPVEWLDYSTS